MTKNPDLGLTFLELKRYVGRYLGFDRDPTNWSANESTDVNDVIKDGLRLFYRPPRLPEEGKAYQWSFLRPHGNVTMMPSQDDYLMPEDFAGIDGALYFVQADFATIEVTIVNEHRIRALRQRHWYNTTQYYPRYAAIIPNQTEGESTQRYTMMVWPKPDNSYTMNYKYFARQRCMGEDTEVPLGGGEHAETIKAACIAAAEAHLDDEVGPKRAIFLDNVRASVDFDRKASSPETLGYNDNNECSGHYGYIRSSRLTPYEKYPAP